MARTARDQVFPVVGWAEWRGWLAGTHGNSVPRFRHRVTELLVEDGAVKGVAGDVLEPSEAERDRHYTEGVQNSTTKVKLADYAAHLLDRVVEAAWEEEWWLV